MKKRGVLVIGFVVLSVFFLFIIISSLQIVSAGPYGYGDSADLKYYVDDEKIIYGYSDNIKYETSLRTKGASVGDWRNSEDNVFRGRIVDKTWEEILLENDLNTGRSSSQEEGFFEGVIVFFRGLFGGGE